MRIYLEIFSVTKAFKSQGSWIATVIEDSGALNRWFNGTVEPNGLFGDKWLSKHASTNVIVVENVKISAKTLHTLGRYFKAQNDIDSLNGITELLYEITLNRTAYMTITAL